MSSSSKPVGSLTGEELVKEVSEYRTLMRELKAKLECPVCLTIPREGPVPCCPRGHLVCNGCLKAMTGRGQKNCPTCRESMGEGKSLLGKVLIENIYHRCDLKGCKEMVHFKNYEQHRKDCNYRLVICPGENERCKEMVPFCEVEHHARTCPNIFKVRGKTRIEYKIPHANVNRASFFGANVMNIDNNIFFLRARKDTNNFIAELVMKADQEKCNNFTATISILDSKSRPAYLGKFSPRPLGTSNEEDDCMSVRMKSLAKVFKAKDGMYIFKVSVDVKKTTLAEDESEESESDSDESESDMEEVAVDLKASEYFTKYPKAIANPQESSLKLFNEDAEGLPEGWKVRLLKDPRDEGKTVRHYLSPDMRVLKTGQGVVEYLRLEGSLPTDQILGIAKSVLLLSEKKINALYL